MIILPAKILKITCVATCENIRSDWIIKIIISAKEIFRCISIMNSQSFCEMDTYQYPSLV